MATPESTASGGLSSWWVLEAQDLWLSGALDKCVHVLEKNFASVSPKQVASAPSEDAAVAKKTQPSKPVFEAAALLHNIILAKYLLSGVVVAVDIPSTPEGSDPNGKAAQKKPNSSPAPSSMLDISRYKPQSIKRALAALGYHTPTAWYNLALLFFVKGQFRQSARIAEECLERGSAFDAVLLDAGVAVQFHFLMIFSHIKLFHYSHPRITTSLNWLEKTLSAQLDDLRKKAVSQGTSIAFY